MEIFELVLVLLACVIASAVLDQIVSRVSLPLLQIAVGLVAALVLPELAHIHVDPELFLVLFIAPLLFNEAREATKRELWVNKGAIVSLAVGLVLLTVLVVGFALHAIVPSVGLAAAFALAAALGPTDAAAVGALGSTVSLTTRQRTLLSGEALINDASGVVAFQFAIAAAVTGAFSALDATRTFAVLFFGGIIVGALLGAAAFLSMDFLRRRGFENTTVHVLYEVFTPFMVFLAAEAVGVSGILAVVAAGLVMAQRVPRLASADAARQQMVSQSFWEIIIYLINGVIFVLLGIQLPQAFSPNVIAVMSPPALIATVVAITALVMLCRFVWLAAMELPHRDAETGARGIEHAAQTLKESLVTTLAGPKGAVTLSIIMTIPLTMAGGRVFPNRELIIFIAAGVILLTLLLADYALPRLAPSQACETCDEQRREARISVLKATVAQLEDLMESGERPEYEHALRLSLARYRTRLNRERFDLEGGFGQEMQRLMNEVLDVQQAHADEVQLDPKTGMWDPATAASYYAMLRGIRGSVGYFGRGQKVGARFRSLRGNLYLLKQRLLPLQEYDDRAERIYYDACLFAIDLEHVAIDYLEGVVAGQDEQRAQVARIMITEHQAVLRSLWGRLNYGLSEQDGQEPTAHDYGAIERMPAEARRAFSEQFANARRYADEVDALALAIEHDEIRRMLEAGQIDEDVAARLREDVYLFQMQLSE